MKKGKVKILRQCSSQLQQILTMMQPSFRNFPKEEREIVVTLIIKNFTTIVGLLNLAIQVKSKRLGYLQEAQAHLYTLRSLIHFCKDCQYISLGFFQDIDLRLTSVDTDLITVFR